MVETRPKRSAAAKAESENKRIAFAARGPVEATDLLTQDVVERERPAAHRRTIIQPEPEPEPQSKKTKTPEKPSNTRKPTRANGPNKSSQVQVVIPPPHSTNRKTSNTASSNSRAKSTGPSNTRSQSVPATDKLTRASPPASQPDIAASRSRAQYQSATGVSRAPVNSRTKASIVNSNPQANPQANGNNATKNSQQGTSLPDASRPNIQAPRQQHPQAQNQGQFPTGSGPNLDRGVGSGSISKPTLIEQVKSVNRKTLQQHQQYQTGNSSSISSSTSDFPTLAHPQPTNALAISFDAAGPAHRAVTKSAEGRMTSQAPAIDAVAAQNLVRTMSPEQMMRLVGLAHLSPGQYQQVPHAPQMEMTESEFEQRLQQGLLVQRALTPQSATGHHFQQAKSLPPIGTSQPGPGQLIQQGVPPQPTSAPRPRTHSFPPGHPAGLASVSPPKPNQPISIANGQATVSFNRSRASSEAPGGSMLPPNLPRTSSAYSAVSIPRPSQKSTVSNGQIPVLSTLPRASSEIPAGPMLLPGRRRSNSANSAFLNPKIPVEFRHGLAFPPPNPPSDPPPAGGKSHFDYPHPHGLLQLANNPNRPPPRIKLNFNLNAAPREQKPDDSDATLSPSPLKAPQLGRAIPSSPLSNKAHAPAEASSSRSHPVARAISQVENRPLSVPLTTQDHLTRQRNLDFQYKVNLQPREFGPNFAHIPLHYLHRERKYEEQPLPQRQPNPPPAESGVALRIQQRSDALERVQDRTPQESEDLRLSDALSKTLMTLKLGRAIDKAQGQKIRRPSNAIPQCLAVTQLPAAIETTLRSRPETFHEFMMDDDDDACVFCNYEASFGISDSRVWLPEEASQGFCSGCYAGTQEVFKMWNDPYKLPYGLSPERKDGHAMVLQKANTPPLKELSDLVDFKAQTRAEMSKPQRVNAILTASRPCMKDGRKDRREQRKEYNLVTSVRNLPRGGKLPERRAVSGGQMRDSSAADVQRSDPEIFEENNLQISNPVRSMPPAPFSLNIHVPRVVSNPVQATKTGATQTGWVNGAPMTLPTSNSPLENKNAMGRAREAHGRVTTPNSAVFMGLLDLSAPPGSGISNTATSSGAGTPNSGITASPSPDPSSASSSTYLNIAPLPRSSSAQSSGPSGIPQYFNPGPTETFLSQPPFNSGPVFCRGCPWRLVDFTKAKICTACRDCKFLICSHMQHLDFQILVEMPGIVNREHKGHGLGRVTRDGIFITDGRYINCMICPGHATHGCEECPLRLCGECVSRMTLCKGKLNELVNFYNTSREHIRNDAFLLRNDNKGF